MKILGLDVGDKKIGVAISDSLLLIAQGLKTISRDSDKKAIDEIVDIIKDKKVKKIVVGLPKHMNNTLGEQADKTKKFMDKLAKKIKYTDRLDYNVDIFYFDERLTSRSAERLLIKGNVSRENRKKVIDKVAASIILQNYLDSL
ncbi:MAG: Holliday junction resolvase RuvX [Bacillota bacterium]